VSDTLGRMFGVIKYEKPTQVFNALLEYTMTNTSTRCDDIESGILKIRRTIEEIEKPESFKSLTVQELRWLKEHKASMYTLSKRLENLLRLTFGEETT